MNIVGHHHHHLMHDPFPFFSPCHQDNPYLGNNWWVNKSKPRLELGVRAPTWTEELEALPFHGGGQSDSSSCMVKHRTAAPKKERRRTENINMAFAELRDCIPNVPSDTKLSKIKTLRLATSYIAYLMDVLAKGRATDGFKAEIKNCDSPDLKRKRTKECIKCEDNSEEFCREKKFKGRTGWPEQVWALELNQ